MYLARASHKFRSSKNTNDEIGGWIVLGCLAIGAIAVAAAAAPAVATTGVCMGPSVFMGPKGGLFRIVGNRKVYDVAAAATAFKCCC